MGKYYVVWKGLKPGIYTSWEECKSQVYGYSGAKYKSFSTFEEADQWFKSYQDQSEPIQIKSSNPENEITGDYAFVDGSYDHTTQTYSYGVVICIADQIYEMSGTDTQNASLRNVAGEILAALKAAEFAQAHGSTSLTIFHDYLGISHWIDGSWECKNFAVANYRDQMKQFIQAGLNITFVHVNGHTGIVGNERVDILAKQALGLI